MSDTIECDVAIIGAGPAGLSAAIRLMQCAEEAGAPPPNVMVLEKGVEVGAHILSGCVLEPRALNELIPDWQEKGAPLDTPANSDSFRFLTAGKAIAMPTPPQMHNKGNYIISLSRLCRWLGEQAEGMGVQVFPGFAAAEAIIEDGVIKGVRTGAMGLDKDGNEKDGYQPPMEIRAKHTLFAEGCRGSISKQLMAEFDLRKDCDPQTYGIGIKEVWEIPAELSKPGSILHTIGWPLDSNTYGGSFVYHMAENKLAIGFVVGLDYSNPYLDPYMEFQRFKTHPSIRPLLEQGTRLQYGARAINEGGYQSVPKLTMKGGSLIGCAAGFLNVPKIKGTHTAMKSGMLAAEAAFTALAEEGQELSGYEEAIRNSWVWDELKAVRNIRPSFHKGLWAGLAYSAVDTYVLRGKAPWTLRNHADHSALTPAAQHTPIAYPAPDGKVSFDRTSSVYLSNTNHEENQPCHLTLKDASVPQEVNLPVYAGPEARFCPAGVYEYVETPEGGKRLQINAQNCVHCKTCDIKDPEQNINWVPPEGGGGPIYTEM
jgi:electron-transferring-flavoprotein dehydrogenase